MKVKLYNQAGEVIGEENLSDDIFGLKVNSDLMHQVVVSQMSNRRQGTAQAKDRSEVRGGGKKPWRQKGTGRARHGSIRSPLWKGGGVTFGPRAEKVYKKVVPKKMKRAALLMALSEKARNGFLIIVDKLSIEKPKTKLAAGILSNLPCCGKTALVALPTMDKGFILASRNIPKTETMQVKDLNALDVLNFKYLVMPKESIKAMEHFYRGPTSKKSGGPALGRSGLGK